MTIQISIEEHVFRSHIDMGPFLSGVARGRWRLISIDWPIVIIAISAAERENGPKEYSLRFDLTNYPQNPPTSRPWNADLDAPLEDKKRPQGPSRVSQLFRTDWKGGVALYFPCDRVALQGHDEWINKHPEMLWDPNADITKYLRIVYDHLNSTDYTGPRCS